MNSQDWWWMFLNYPGQPDNPTIRKVQVWQFVKKCTAISFPVLL